jgi:4-coumarate--CoA ligase
MFVSIFDPERKVWRGPDQKCVYNPEANLGHIILTVLKKTPSQITQISADSGVEVTCREMWIRTVRIAIKLDEMGFKKGDIVGVIALNSEHLAPLVFACFTLGIGMNFMAPNFNLDDIIHMWKTTTPKLVVCDFNFVGMVEKALENLKLSSPIMTLLEKFEGHGFIEDFLMTPQKNENDFKAPNLGNSEHVIGIILCSSGSTGRLLFIASKLNYFMKLCNIIGLPKAVTISQKQIICQMTPFWYARFKIESWLL